MKKKPVTRKPEASVVEKAIIVYETMQSELDSFLSENRELMGVFQQLVEERNVALDAVQRALKQQLLQGEQPKLVIGGFGAQKKISRWYDGKYLADELPACKAELVVEEQIVYKVKVEELEQLVRLGEIDSEIVQKAYHEEKPTAAMLPGMPKPYSVPAIPSEEE